MSQVKTGKNILTFASTTQRKRDHTNTSIHSSSAQIPILRIFTSIEIKIFYFAVETQ